MNLSISDIIKLAVCIVICQLAGILGSIPNIESIPTWYAGLNKPSFNPPNWIFAPVWITLYFLMGLAAFIVWKKGLGAPHVSTALVLFLIQLILNALWTWIFFGWKLPLAAFVEIAILWILILVTIIQFFKISSWAGLLLIPYIVWVSFAAMLNFALWRLNQSEPNFREHFSVGAVISILIFFNGLNMLFGNNKGRLSGGPGDYMLIIFVIVLIAAAAILALARGQKQIASIDLSAAELKKLLDSRSVFRLVDVREPVEYKAGFIAGAELIPWGEIQVGQHNLSKEEKIILYCRSGRRSGLAARFLIETGFKDVKHLAGGLLKWPFELEEESPLKVR